MKKEEGMNHVYLHNFVAAVCKFYKINDIYLNKEKINQFMPEPTRQMKDRAYTKDEINRMTELADERIKALLLLLSSSGVRLGVIPKLKMSDLEEKDDIYKITVYPNTRHEYFVYSGM